jgi:hypothetical protein
MSISESRARPKVQVRPLTAEQRLQLEDMHWARHDPDVQNKYIGQFVVPFQRQIVAHGTNLVTVLEEAARLTGRKPEELPVCGIDDPLQEIVG